MTNSLHDLINETEHQSHAVDAGRRMHLKLQNIVIDGDKTCGDIELISKIRQCSGLVSFFATFAQTELPIAGYINGKFVSRRIDRILINNDARTIDILDYKTDVSRDVLHEKYIRQLNEYKTLMGRIYPGYKITASILWTHDWELEQIG